MRIEALSAISEHLAHNLSFPGVAQELAEALVHQAGAAACRIWVAGPGDRCQVCPLAGECTNRVECLHLAAVGGCDVGADGSHARYPIGARTFGRVASTHAPFVCHQPASDQRLADAAILSAAHITCCTAWPLMCDNETLGVLVLYAREPMSDVDLQQIAALAKRSAQAIGNALVAEKSRRRELMLELQNQLLTREILSARYHEQVLGNSPAAVELRERIARLATQHKPVLISGPMGCGKELAARALHAHGPLRQHPFIRIDCRGALEEHLECELFGQEAGAGICSLAARPGLLEVAEGGILFLKHVTELPGMLQERLLRALRSGWASRLGSDSAYAVRVRIVASCITVPHPPNPLLGFLGQSFLSVPALRGRGEDISSLVEHNLRRFGRLYGKSPPELGIAEMDRLRQHGWPGNVRELINLADRIVLSSGDAGLPPDLPEGCGMLEPELVNLENLERAHIIRVLRHTRGVIQGEAGAAAILGLRPSTLRSRMSKLNIPRQP